MNKILLTTFLLTMAFNVTSAQKYDCSYLDQNCIGGRQHVVSEEELEGNYFYCNSFLKYTEFLVDGKRYYINKTGNIYSNKDLKGKSFLKLTKKGDYGVYNFLGRAFITISNSDFIMGTHGELYLLDIAKKNIKELISLPFNEGFFLKEKDQKLTYTDEHLCKAGTFKIFDTKSNQFTSSKGSCPENFKGLASTKNLAIKVFKKDTLGNILKDGHMNFSDIDCKEVKKKNTHVNWKQ
jgi:hypothetical protein